MNKEDRGSAKSGSEKGLVSGTGGDGSEGVVDTSRGNKLGQGMQDITGPEMIKGPKVD